MQFTAWKRDMARAISLATVAGDPAIKIKTVSQGSLNFVTFTAADTFRGVTATAPVCGGVGFRTGEYYADAKEFRRVLAAAKPRHLVMVEASPDILDGRTAALSVTIGDTVQMVRAERGWGVSWEMPEPSQWLSWPAGALAGALKAVAYATERGDSTRYYVSGVFFRYDDGKVTLAATDGHRLVQYESTLDAGAESEWPENTVSTEPGRRGFILPNANVAALQRALKGQDVMLDVGIREKSVTIMGPDFEYHAACIDGMFPGYCSLFPDANCPDRRTVIFDFQTFARRLELAKPTRNQAMRLGKVSKTATAEIPGGPDLNGHNICVDAKYVADLADTFLGDLSLNYNPDRSGDPLLIWDPDRSAARVALMPRRD